MVHQVHRRNLPGFTLGFAMLALAGACLQPSLNPLFLPEETLFDETLLGAWTCPGEVWTFSRESYGNLPDRPYYLVTIEADNQTAEMAAWLGRLDKTWFVTFRSGGLDFELPTDFVRHHVVATHTFGRISIETTRVRLAMLDADWIQKAEAAGQLTIGVRRWLNDEMPSFENVSRPPESRHPPSPDPRDSRWLSEVILTAPPRDLQRFARTYADDENVFAETIELVRRPSSDAVTSAEAASQRGSCYSMK
jgi:hypothetical protein